MEVVTERLPTFAYRETTMEEQIRSFLRDAGNPMTAQDISKGIKKTKKEVNQIIYKMSDVEKTDDTPPKWMLRGGSSSTVTVSSLPLEVSTSKIDSTTGMSLDVASPSTPSASTSDEPLKQKIRAILNESGTTPTTAAQLARKLNDSSIKMADVKRLLYDMATNVAPNGQKPMWILPEYNTTNGVAATPNLPVQLAGKPLFVKEEKDDKIIFTKVKDSDLVVPAVVTDKEDETEKEGIGNDSKQCSSDTKPLNEDVSDEVKTKPNSKSGEQLAADINALQINDVESSSQEEKVLKTKVLQFLSNHPEDSFLAKHIAKEVGALARHVVMVCLDKLVESGEVEKLNDESYKLSKQ